MAKRSNEVKRGVEFCHLARNASRLRRKLGIGGSVLMGTECFNTRFSLPDPDSPRSRYSFQYFFSFLALAPKETAAMSTAPQHVMFREFDGK